MAAQPENGVPSGVARTRRRARRSSSGTTASATTATTRRSPTPNSTSWCASSKRSRRSTRSSQEDSPLARGRAGVAVVHLRAGPHDRAHALARQRLRPRRAARVARARRAGRSPIRSRFVGEPKLDGLAISLLYEDGRSSAPRRGATARPARTSPPTWHDRAHPPRAQGDACRRGWRCAARCSCRSSRSRSSTGARAKRATGSSPTRATRRREACARRTRAITASRDLAFYSYQLGRARGRADARGRTTRRSTGCASSGCPSTTTSSSSTTLDDVLRLLRAHARRTVTRSATRSTARS